MKKHYETHVEDTDKLISVAGPVLDYKSWYEQYRKLMEEQAQRKHGLYTPTSEGDDDDFPSISGMIARYSASGLTNEQMKENPVWVDKTGNGHDLQMKNFLWGGMSGVGGYKLNWGDSSIWANYITQGTFGTGEVTDNTIHITSTKTNNALFETRASLKSVEYKVLIKGLTDDIYLRYGVFNDGKELWAEIKNDGIYTLPSYDYDSRYNMKWKVMSQTYPIDCNITIEQLPLYPGFILGDGVDDFAVTEKELNFEDTYTVYTAFIPFQSNPTRNMILCGADSKKTFSMQYSSLVYLSFIAGNNYYINAAFVNGLNLFACKRNGNNICIKNLLTNKVVTGTCGDWVENAGLYYLWKNATYASFAKAAIAGQTICNGYFSTDEDDEKVLNWYKKQYPWLFPDQAWTVTGKTNEDENRATIANITGNGNDLVLSNFGFAEGSGYGLYKLNFNNWFANSGSGNVNIVNVVNPHKIVLEQSQEAVGAFFLGKNVSYSGELKISVSNKPSDIELSFGSTALGKVILNEGINIVKINPVNTSIGFFTNKAFEAQNIIIEQILEYEGYLVTDGVDDKITSSAFEMDKDFTIVGDWKFIIDENKGCGLVKVPKLFIYNSKTGLDIYINSNSIKNILSGIKGLNAVCSDGRVYDCNWNEISVKYDNMVDINSSFLIANSGNIFTKTAFKNLGIYNNQLLSKEDCIKAYNYLQTLKAK